MKKIQVFSHDNAEILQTHINEWLSLNKDIEIISNNMTTTSAVNKMEATTRFSFYILYSPQGDDAVASFMKAQQPEPSQNVDIPPELLDI